MPVFFIQDGIKFPDIVHAVKPEPHHEMPQASSAHDTFWDFISLVPETAHMVMWLMSDRAIPRSFRMMEGFGVHTFKLVNARGQVQLCKFHWKPLLGAHSLVWDEAQKLAGKDPDFHRRDLWEAIECGHFPEYELGLQVVDEKDEQAFGFDLLDPTKLLPEELVPVRRIGKMTLDHTLLIGHPVMYDAICVIADAAGVAVLMRSPNAIDFVLDGFRHAKTLGAVGEAVSLVERLLGDMRKSPGVILAPRAAELVEPFIDAMRAHRHFERELEANAYGPRR